MQSNKTIIDVAHIAALANLQITDAQKEKFSSQLSSVLGYMAKIQSLNTDGVAETAQVTGLTNVFREDIIDDKRTFTQEEALQNAKRTYNGYFVVPAVFE
ncbi:MAG: Asp-tRNA(Asn)/Glu-tRNA(Gln) amidotransferase subunit GatC [Candidatus Gottesmanbacteria bacterium]